MNTKQIPKHYPNVMTIRETVQRSREEGIPISEYAVRKWIKDGKLQTTYTGKKALIYWPSFVRTICGLDSDSTCNN